MGLNDEHDDQSWAGDEDSEDDDEDEDGSEDGMDEAEDDDDEDNLFFQMRRLSGCLRRRLAFPNVRN